MNKEAANMKKERTHVWEGLQRRKGRERFVCTIISKNKELKML